MYRRVDCCGTTLRWLTGAALAATLNCGAWAGAQAPAKAAKPIPDAQVEAGVLRALAGASDLATQPITTTTVYGVVTLSGTVQTEVLRTEAETLTSRAAGVQKVIDEMTLSSDASNSVAQPTSAQRAGGVLQSDGTVAPQTIEQNNVQAQAPIAQGSPNSDNVQSAGPAPSEAPGPNYGPGAPEYGRQNGRRPGPPPDGYAGQGGYPHQPGYDSHHGYRNYDGQVGGEMVTVPGGAVVRVRINQSLDSGRVEPGTRFDGVVVNDIIADGTVAIPRGATVQGTVVDAKKSGALTGRGELSLQLTEVTLAGRSYPLASNVWNHHGGDKTTETVNKTAVGGGLGALFGAVVGGGAGAAVGAGVGGALGLGSSAASGNGQVYVPSEGLLTFQLAQPATVATVSQQEMNRLAQGVPPGAEPQRLRRRVYPYPVYGPVYYPPYPPYRPYPYPY